MAGAVLSSAYPDQSCQMRRPTVPGRNTWGILWLLALSVGLSPGRGIGAASPEGKIISKIEIQGNQSASAKSIRRLMETRSSSWLRRRRFDQKVFERDLQAILMSYQNNGYLSASIQDRRLEIDPADTTVSISIRLNEGPRYFVRHVLVEGNAKLTDAQVVEQLRLRPDKPFRRLLLDDDLAGLQVFYAEHGMVDSHITQSVSFDHQEAAAYISYAIQEGVIVHIDRIRIEGSKKVHPHVIQRELTFSPRTRYNHLKSIQSQANLFRTGFFSQVSISLESATPDASVRDVVVRVVERQTGEVNFGVGYGTLDRARLSLEAAQKCVAGAGFALAFEGKLGSYDRSARVSLATKWLLGLRLDADADGLYRYVEKPAYTTEEFGTQLGLRRRLTARTSVSAGASVKRTVLLAGDVPQQPGRTNAVQAELVRDTRNDLLSPVRGSLQRLEMAWAGGPLGGHHAFIKVQARASRFFQLARRWVFCTSVRAGRLTRLRGGDIPVYHKFFAGGARSVRGYSAESIGAYAVAPGGLLLFTAQNELRLPLWFAKEMGGTLLVDFGQTWRRTSEVTLRSIKVGFGGGIRVDSPFGLARFDLAVPAHKALAWERVGYYAGIGQAF